MKSLFLFILACLITPFVNGQTTPGQQKKDAIIEELKTLFKELNEAIQKHDRSALEKIYADEFLFIHGFGYIDSKTEQINGIMESDSVSVLAVPSFDQLYVYDDMAVLRLMSRNPVAGNNLMSTTIYAKRKGKWQIIQVQSTQQQRERKIIKVDNTILDTYIGEYVQPNGSTTIVTRAGDNFLIQLTGKPKQSLSAVSATQFFDKFGSSITFQKDAGGKLTHYIWRSQNGQEVKWTKME